MRFALIYAGLGVVLVGAHSSGSASSRPAPPGTASPPPAGRRWKPANGTTAKMTKEIADHVAGEYHLNKKGTQLVAVVSGPPQVTNGTRKVTISNLAGQAGGDDQQGHPDRPVRAACGPTSSAA